MNQENILISIIIPVYNNENYINECLTSVINQTYKNIEIIIVNDGSTDRSKDKCLHFCKNDKRIIFIEKDNEGVSVARNTALTYATGEYITFLDADDKYCPYALERMLNVIRERNSDIAICSFTVEDSVCLTEQVTYKCISNYSEYIQDLLFNQNVKGFVWNKLYKRDLFCDIKFPTNLIVCEDLYVNCLIAKKFHPNVVIFDEQLYYYRDNKDSVTRNILKLFNNHKFVYDIAYDQIKDLFVHDIDLINVYINQSFLNIVIYTSFALFQNKLISSDYNKILKNTLKNYSKGITKDKKLYIKYCLFHISPRILYYLHQLNQK